MYQICNNYVLCIMFSYVLWSKTLMSYLVEKVFFVTLIQNDEETYEQIIEIGRKNDYTTSNLLDYEYFLKHYKLIAIDNALTVV